MNAEKKSQHTTEVETFDDGTVLVSIDGQIRWAGKREDALILANTIISEVGK
jgi:hypothetical protein